MSFSRRLVVDQNVNWLDLSSAPESGNTAFILGTTIHKEASPIRLLVEDKNGVFRTRQNVFNFGVKYPTQKDMEAGYREPMIVITRLNAETTAILDLKGLRKFNEPDGGGKLWDTSEAVLVEKKRILALLETNSIKQLKVESIQKKDAELAAYLVSNLRKCFKNFDQSEIAARYGYARLLLRSPRTRNEFEMQDYPNVFGDLQLVQNALFLQASILSKDKGVHKMARFCGVPYVCPK